MSEKNISRDGGAPTSKPRPRGRKNVWQSKWGAAVVVKPQARDAIASGDEAVREAIEACALLTARDRDVLILMSKGLTHTEIGSALGIAKKTVEGKASAIYRKFEVRGAVEAAVMACKAGLV